MNFEINSIWTDWRLKVPNGVPNPFNDYHLVLLKEICFNHNVDQGIVNDVILFLEKDEKIDPDTPIKYKDKEGNQVETTYKKAIQRDKEHPARIEAEKLRKSGGKEEPEKEEPKASGMSTDDYASTALTSEPDVEKEVDKDSEEKEYKLEISETGMKSYRELANDKDGDIKLEHRTLVRKNKERQLQQDCLLNFN